MVLDDVQVFVGWVKRGLRSGWLAMELIKITILYFKIKLITPFANKSIRNSRIQEGLG